MFVFVDTMVHWTERIRVRNSRRNSIRISDSDNNNDIVLVEGLVVDTRDGGGVGFRNHSVPVEASNGATWTEDLLWVRPVTSCVNTNLTFLIHAVDQFDLSATLIDNGTGYGCYFSLL
jgi:hypothetical protein